MCAFYFSVMMALNAKLTTWHPQCAFTFIVKTHKIGSGATGYIHEKIIIIKNNNNLPEIPLDYFCQQGQEAEPLLLLQCC